MKVSRLERIIRLVAILQSESYHDYDELAAQLGVTRRTIFRDLKTLQSAGVPCYHDEEKGGYHITDSFYLRPLNLTLPETLALLLVAQHDRNSQTLPLQRQAYQAALKIQSALPSHLREHCCNTLRTVSVRPGARVPHDRLEESFAQLQRAIRERRQVEMTYDSLHDKEVLELALEPLHLHFSRRAWYVIGRSLLHEEIRTFKLKRIQQIKVLNKRFVLEKPFRIDAYLGNAWALMPEGEMYRVRLRFTAMVAQNVAEVLWHRTQEITWQKDGRLVYEADVDGLTEISWWILGYGDQVEVLGPEKLRGMIAERVENMGRLYAGDLAAQEVDAAGSGNEIIG